MGRISDAWTLMRASRYVLAQHPRIVVLPVVVGVCVLPLSALVGCTRLVLMSDGHADGAAAWAAMFVGDFAEYAAATFGSAAVILFAMRTIAGGEATLRGALRAAWVQVPTLAGWALLCATAKLGAAVLASASLATAVLALVLTIATPLLTYLALPVLALERERPVHALVVSARLFGSVWVEELTGIVSFAVLGLVFGLPFIAFGWAAIQLGGVAKFAALALVALVMAAVMLALAVQQTVFRTTLYLAKRAPALLANLPEDVLPPALVPDRAPDPA